MSPTHQLLILSYRSFLNRRSFFCKCESGITSTLESFYVRIYSLMGCRILRRLSGCNLSKDLSVLKMSSSALDSIKEVDIDPEGTFKYILMKVYAVGMESDLVKMIVRGYARCAYHADIFEEVSAKELLPKNLSAECLGGGRIQHDPMKKTIKVYGYSQGFGRADHTVSVNILKQVYSDYTITASDEGY